MNSFLSYCSLRPLIILILHNNVLEIPNALELIGKGYEQEVTGGTNVQMRKIVFSSLLRLALGYLFLLSLFLVVIQESTVLGIFFDVLALAFVENIDDAVFILAKRGEVSCLYLLFFWSPPSAISHPELNDYVAQDSSAKNSG